MSERGNPERLFHGNNKAHWDQFPEDKKWAKYWTPDPFEAFSHALNNAYKFNSEPLILVHHDPTGDTFTDITEQQGGSAIFEPNGFINPESESVEVFHEKDLDLFFEKYFPNDIERMRKHVLYNRKRRGLENE